MNILWFSWKDLKNPEAGGAEVITDQLASALVKRGDKVILLTSGFPNCIKKETINDYEVIRLGGKFSVYFFAFTYYLKNLQGWPDKVIEEINTFPFFTQFYIGMKPYIYIFQLAGKIWFYQALFPLNIIGYFIEPIYLRFFKKNRVLTESESTVDDLIKLGFKKQNIHIVPISLTMPPLKFIHNNVKFENPTLLSLGSIRSMKQTHFQIRAFELVKKRVENLKLIVAGNSDGKYGKKILSMINDSPYSDDIHYAGTVSLDEKILLLKKSHILLMSSVKEGWGLVVTEAASQGTPSIVFDVSGLRNSVKNNITGIICSENTVKNMAEQILELIINKKKYLKLKNNALEDAKSFTLKKSVNKFFEAIR